jgi:cytochrome c556
VTRRVKQVLATSLVAAVATVGASIAVRAASVTETIKDRQHAMDTINDAVKVLAAMAKKEAPFDAATVKKSAETIAENFKKAEGLFPPGSDKADVETRAKPEIWSDPEMFQETLKSVQAAAVELQSVSEEAALRPALAKLGTNCKDCHDMYRVPKH